MNRSAGQAIRASVGRLIGQMLDYAANGVIYWPAERLRSDFEARCAGKKKAGNADSVRPRSHVGWWQPAKQPGVDLRLAFGIEF
jgi:hypothetical protein